MSTDEAEVDLNQLEDRYFWIDNSKQYIELLIEIKSRADEVGSYDNKIYMTYDDMVEDQSFKTGKFTIDTISSGAKGSVNWSIEIVKKDSLTKLALVNVGFKLQKENIATGLFEDYIAPGQSLIKYSDLDGVIILNRVETGECLFITNCGFYVWVLSNWD